MLREGERYVGRTKLQDAHIIAKLPVVGYPFLPELEHLSLQLADKAGVNVCHAVLEPLRKLAVEHGFDLGEAGQNTCSWRWPLQAALLAGGFTSKISAKSWVLPRRTSTPRVTLRLPRSC